MAKNVDDTQIFVDKYFDFLAAEFGFEKIIPYHVAYEYHFGYRKENIEIDISCESDGSSLPWVTLLDHRDVTKIKDTNFPAYYELTQIEVSDKMKQIFSEQNERRGPKVKKLIESKNGYTDALKELDDDYEAKGREELEIILREYVGIIKRHPEILKGDLSVFPPKGFWNSLKSLFKWALLLHRKQL